MKLFGSKPGKRNATGNTGKKTNTRQKKTHTKNDDIGSTDNKANTPGSDRKRSNKTKMPTRKKVLLTVAIILGAVVLVLGAALLILRYEIQPFYDLFYPKPDDRILAEARTPRVPRDPNNPDQTIDPDRTPAPLDEVRSLEKLSFLILGLDKFGNLRTQGGTNTDVVMIATFDMEAQTLNIASIPRDTIVNVPWNLKKINSIWSNMVSRNRDSDDIQKAAMQDTMDLFSDFLGFNLDFSVMLDMRAFVKLIDALPGVGVKYTLQKSFHFDDPDIGLNVTLPAGENTFNGEEALALVRYRGYSDGDFGRINTQQQFLTSAAKQILSQSSQISITTYADIFINNVQTDIDLTTIIRIGREMLKLDADNINFFTAPCTPIRVETPGVGLLYYMYVDVDGWLEIINTKLNTFYEDITPYHVSILTRGSNGKFYVTDDHWQGSRNWGS